MPFGRRLQWSFGLFVVVALIAALADMLLSFGIVGYIFSPWVVVPELFVAWLLAPWAARHINFK